MPVTAEASRSSRSRHLTKRIRGSIVKVMRKKAVEVDSQKHAGPHWRPSINELLFHSGSWTCHSTIPPTKETDVSNTFSRLLALPTELLQQIEECLAPSDAVSLRQTCRKLRYEALYLFEVPFLDFLDSQSLRKRLDRDYFSVLCVLEHNGQLNHKLAACSFCLSIHGTKQFPAEQLKFPPQLRECSAAAREYRICGHYGAYPAELRRTLDLLLKAQGGEDFAINHRVLMDAGLSSQIRTFQFALSGIIEDVDYLPEHLSKMYVDDTGLVLRHHFHLRSERTAGGLRWNFAGALARPGKGILPVCPHLTVHSAGIRLGVLRAAVNAYTGSCPEQACRTLFGWFECPTEETGWVDLCFRVERRFGWLENVVDEFWKTQIV